MKRTSSAKKTTTTEAGEMRPEYNFDYAKSKPNRFAKKTQTKMPKPHKASTALPARSR